MKTKNTFIIGAGRLGTSIARSLNNHANVTVIDRNPEKIERLADYSGFVEVGDATDTQLLENCGIETADRVILVTNDDNVNIFLADLCAYHYSIPEIFVRLKDSRKAKLVDPKAICICPFDLSLDFFAQNNESEGKE